MDCGANSCCAKPALPDKSFPSNLKCSAFCREYDPVLTRQDAVEPKPVQTVGLRTWQKPALESLISSLRVSALELQPFATGDLVIYTVSKQSPHPGPRARAVQPSPLGEDYAYVVDKFWIVARMMDPHHVMLATRTGKTHVVSCDDPLLRKANWWQKLRHRDRFPTVEVLKKIHGSNSALLREAH